MCVCMCANIYCTECDDFYSFAAIGFLATTVYKGVKMPVFPPSMRPSAALSSMLCTLVDPRGARPAPSIATTSMCVIIRPTQLARKDWREHRLRPCRMAYQGSSPSSALSLCSRISKPAVSRAFKQAEMCWRFAIPLPSCKNKA